MYVEIKWETFGTSPQVGSRRWVPKDSDFRTDQGYPWLLQGIAEMIRHPGRVTWDVVYPQDFPEIESHYEDMSEASNSPEPVLEESSESLEPGPAERPKSEVELKEEPLFLNNFEFANEEMLSEPSEPFELSEQLEPSGPLEPSEPSEQLEASELLEPSESSKPLESSEQSEPLKSYEPLELFRPFELWEPESRGSPDSNRRPDVDDVTEVVVISSDEEPSAEEPARSVSTSARSPSGGFNIPQAMWEDFRLHQMLREEPPYELVRDFRAWQGLKHRSSRQQRVRLHSESGLLLRILLPAYRPD